MKHSDNWIDDVIKQHKKQLEYIKKNRSYAEESDIKNDIDHTNTEEKVNYYVDTEGREKNLETVETKDNKYLNIKENFSIDSADEDRITLKTNYDQVRSYSQHSNRYSSPKDVFGSFIIDNKSQMSKVLNTEENVPRKSIEINNDKIKYENKKKQYSELKNNYNIIKEENKNLKNLKDYDTQNEEINKILKREKELIEELKKLDKEKTDLEAKLKAYEKTKSKEFESMSEKIKEFDKQMEEHSSQYINTIKDLKIDIDEYKIKNVEFTKIIDALNQFFKKLNSNYKIFQIVKNQINSKNVESKLNEIENFIIKITNEKNSMNEKYNKLLNIQSKLTHSDMLDNSILHLDTVKKLNEKIFDLTEENNNLKNQINQLLKSKDIHKEESLSKIDKENIFTNNLIKDEDKKMKSSVIDCDTSGFSNILVENYKTLEQRVLELERGLKNKEKDYKIINDKSKSKEKKKIRDKSELDNIKTKVKHKKKLKNDIKDKKDDKYNVIRNMSSEPIRRIKQVKNK